MYSQVLKQLERISKDVYAQVSLIVWPLERHLTWNTFQTKNEKDLWNFLAKKCFPLLEEEVNAGYISSAQQYCLALRIENLRLSDCVSPELTERTFIGRLINTDGLQAVKDLHFREADEFIANLENDTTTKFKDLDGFCMELDKLVACLRVCGDTLLSYCPRFVEHVIEHVSPLFLKTKFNWKKKRMVEALVCFTHLLMAMDLYFSGQDPPALSPHYHDLCISICGSVLGCRPTKLLNIDFYIETGISLLILRGGIQNLSAKVFRCHFELATRPHTTRRSWNLKLHFLSLSCCFLLLHFQQKKVSFCCGWVWYVPKCE